MRRCNSAGTSFLLNLYLSGMAAHNIKQGCVRLRNALKCNEMHFEGHCYNRVELLTSKGAEKSTVASAADCEVEADSLTAGHERKHNACRAESEVALVVIPISAE